MNNSRISPQGKRIVRNALVVLALATLLGAVLGFYLAPAQPWIEPLVTTPNFVGGVVVMFRDGVSAARVNEIITSVGGTAVYKDRQLNQVVARFNPSLTLMQAEEIAKRLRTVSDVESAAPEFEVPVN